jgi:hypothetical protein
MDPQVCLRILARKFKHAPGVPVPTNIFATIGICTISIR